MVAFTIPTSTLDLPNEVFPLDRPSRLELRARYWRRRLAVVCALATTFAVGGLVAGRVAAGRLLVFKPGDRITVTATSPSRIAVVGGAAMDGPRHIWWNFVSSRKERIEQAKEDWKTGRFEEVPGETEFIPLPER